MSRVELRKHLHHNLSIESMEFGEDVIFMCQTCGFPVAMRLQDEDLMPVIEEKLPPGINLTDEEVDILLDNIMAQRDDFEDSEALDEVIDECIDDLLKDRKEE